MTYTRTIAATLSITILGLASWQAPHPASTAAIVPNATTEPVPIATVPVPTPAGDEAEHVKMHAAVEAQTAEPPVGLTVIGGTTEQRESVEWAVAHFAGAGLELPGMVIEMHTSDRGCDGYDGAFRSREWRLDVCNPHRLIILHELAHAWEHHSLDDMVRSEFMELRGLVSWNDSKVDWNERGVEDLAEVVVWGLRINNGAATSRDPDRQAAFELVTGVDVAAGREDASTASEIQRVRDRAETDLDWDILR